MTRGTCEQYSSIDVRVLARQGLLAPGAEWTRPWRSFAFENGSISAIAYNGSIEFIFGPAGAAGREYELRQRVDVVHTYPTYGNLRFWFRCPSCSRRCAKLHGGWWPGCRRCLKLVYASQYESAARRSLRRAISIRRRLGGAEIVGGPLPERPKGMRRATYERLLFELRQAERRGARVRRRPQDSPRVPAA
jgi:hypothetical protein